MNAESNPNKCMALEETLVQRMQRRERQLRELRLPVTSDAAWQRLDEKVRAVIENGKRVGTKVDALVELIRQRLQRDGADPTS